jgi:hypothetical protein
LNVYSSSMCSGSKGFIFYISPQKETTWNNVGKMRWL